MKIIIYPTSYYDAVFKMNEVCCQLDDLNGYPYYGQDAFNLLVNNEKSSENIDNIKIISEETYKCLWDCILQDLRYNKDKYIESYWSMANTRAGLFQIQKDDIEGKLNDEKINNIIQKENNAELQSKLEKQLNFVSINVVDKFNKFHYILCALLLYKGKYQLLKKIMNYTDSVPYKYYLVPSSVDDVIEAYIKLFYDDKFYDYEYPFPDIDHMKPYDTVSIWIKKYMVILFLRLYKIPYEYINYSTKIDVSLNPPTDNTDISIWSYRIQDFKRDIELYRKDKELLEAFGLEELYDDNWIKGKKDPNYTPTELLEKLGNKFYKQKITNIKENTLIQDKIDEFNNRVVNRLNKFLFKQYKDIFNNKRELKDTSQPVTHCNIFIPREYFIYKESYAYEFETLIFNEIDSGLYNFTTLHSFSLMQNKKFLLKQENIFKAIDNLKIDKDNFVILNFGLNLRSYSHNDDLKDKLIYLNKEQNKFTYNGIEIKTIKTNYSYDRLLIVIKKEDLPKIEFNDVNENIIYRYKLVETNNLYHIYNSIIDLNSEDNKAIREECEKTNRQNIDLDLNLLSCTYLNAVLKYNKEAKCVIIQEYDYSNRYNPNNLLEVKSFEEL
jgi:hypothetical protein